MEKIMNSDERIRRAEEIYYRRRNQNLGSSYRNTHIYGRERKRNRPLRKLIMQIIFCMIIYLSILVVKNCDYIFTQEFLNSVKNVLNYNVELERYYNNTEADTPKKNVKYFVDNISPTFGKAIDIGCGSGNDSVYLIKNGWSVVSIDKENVGERISKRLDAEEQKRFKFQQQNFNDMKLEKADLIVANYSLPFCNNEKINYVWKNIVNSIRTNGYFVGNFFGIKDSWNKAESNMTFFTKEQVLNLFDEFDIIKFNEVEKEGLTGLGNMKHWHIFNVIAKKK